MMGLSQPWGGDWGLLTRLASCPSQLPADWTPHSCLTADVAFFQRNGCCFREDLPCLSPSSCSTD